MGSQPQRLGPWTIDQIVLPENPTDEDLLHAALDAQDAANLRRRLAEIQVDTEPPAPLDAAELKAAIQKDFQENLPGLIAALAGRATSIEIRLDRPREGWSK